MNILRKIRDLLTLMRLLVTLTCLSSCLSGCGFHLRQESQLPTQLQTLYFHSVQPYNTLSTDLRESLLALGVHMVNTPKQANFGLRITGYDYSHNDVALTSSTQATTYTFTLITTVAITNRAGKIIYGPQNITTTRSITLNADQVLHNSVDLPANGDMQREAAQLIYQWLIAENTRKALAHASQS